MANYLDAHIPSTELIASSIGVVSAIIDNVPLVAATMGMYDLSSFPQDSEFWQLVAFCAGTGGSMLVIGSAAGVAFMGMEKVDFFWYMRKVHMLLPAILMHHFEHFCFNICHSYLCRLVVLLLLVMLPVLLRILQYIISISHSQQLWLKFLSFMDLDVLGAISKSDRLCILCFKLMTRTYEHKSRTFSGGDENAIYQSL